MLSRVRRLSLGRSTGALNHLWMEALHGWDLRNGFSRILKGARKSFSFNGIVGQMVLGRALFPYEIESENGSIRLLAA